MFIETKLRHEVNKHKQAYKRYTF